MDLVDGHAPLNPTAKGGLLVMGKIVARGRSNQAEDLLDMVYKRVVSHLDSLRDPDIGGTDVF